MITERSNMDIVREKCRRYCRYVVMDEHICQLTRIFAKLNEIYREKQDNISNFNSRLNGNEPKRGYVICYTPRSGSTLLTTTLTQMTLEGAAFLGYPCEIFNTGSMEQRGRHYDCRTLNDYARWALWEVTDASGVFGVKGDLFQILPFLFTETFQELMPSISFVYLTRRDILMQAISLVIAHHTGLWTSESVPHAAYAGDAEEIAANVGMIAETMASWEKIFALSGIDPLRLTYEEIDDNLSGAIQKLANRANIPISMKLDDMSVNLHKTRGPQNDALRRSVIEKFSLSSQGAI